MPRQMAKEQAHYLVDKVPENSTWDDLIHEIYRGGRRGGRWF